ncbi:MAG: hypothetical protein K8R59_01770, partial [Thermoanaerobaculales bacterium]|nr:hypothetical protein [Thermoanaerobaculales bacterium]
SPVREAQSFWGFAAAAPESGAAEDRLSVPHMAPAAPVQARSALESARVLEGRLPALAGDRLSLVRLQTVFPGEALLNHKR